MISLPIDGYLSEILAQLNSHRNLVLSAAPGAGKTTRVPPALAAASTKQVWVLEPRRMAAVAAAHRIAEEQGWELGRQIGYQVRFESKLQPDTRVVFLTEALLTRKFFADPDISECGIVVLDEFHERSLHVDVALGLLKEIQMLSRPDLKIVVMSATIDPKPLSHFLDQAPVMEVPGRLFDLDIQYQKGSQLLRTDHRFIERVVEAVRDEIQSRPKGRDVLVFLPGMSEISRVQKQLSDASWARDLLILPLSGSLSLSDQLRALKPATLRKVILSTNVAESSVTVDGIDTVIDSGLARDVELDTKTGFERIEVRRISKASAKQRAGRSARQFPGRCLRLWNKMDELSMPDYDIGEIHRRDLAETLLLLHGLGVSNSQQFSWFETPDTRKLQNAETFLEKLGALAGGQITTLGRRLVEIPLAPRLGKLLLRSVEIGATNWGADVCALLQEKDLLRQSSGIHDSGCDVCERFEALEMFRHSARRGSAEIIGAQAQTIDQVSHQLRGLVRDPGGSGSHRPAAKDPALMIKDLLIEAYPDRLCRRRKSESLTAVMVGGRGVELDRLSSAKDYEFFIAVELMETSASADSQVRKACGITREQIEQHYKSSIRKISHLVFDESSKNYFSEDQFELWGMPLEEPRRRPANAEQIRDLLPEILTQRLTDVLKTNEELNHWWERWQYFESQRDQAPHFSNEKIKDLFTQASYGENRYEDVIKKDLIYFFEASLPSDVVSDFHQRCPARLTVPSGSAIRIHYHLDKNPHMEVRLQELFGMTSTPTVEGGQVPVTIHLLAPNYRPVQVTSDLMSFWKNTYPEIKKEFKARYPKHSWPDDPLTAQPQAKGRPRR